MAARNGTNNGMWFHPRQVCVQNENVLKFESRSYNDLLAKVQYPDPTTGNPSTSASNCRQPAARVPPPASRSRGRRSALK